MTLSKWVFDILIPLLMFSVDQRLVILVKRDMFIVLLLALFKVKVIKPMMAKLIGLARVLLCSKTFYFFVR